MDKKDKTSKSDIFFGLFTSLIAQIKCAGDTPFDLKQLLVVSVNRMKAHISSEKGSLSASDLTLCGYISLVNDLLSLFIPLVSYEELIQFESQHNLLFEMFY